MILIALALSGAPQPFHFSPAAYYPPMFKAVGNETGYYVDGDSIYHATELRAGREVLDWRRATLKVRSRN